MRTKKERQERLTEIKEDICDNYCRYPGEYFLLYEDPEVAIRIIEQSIIGGYMGLFPLKDDKKQGSKPATNAKTHNFNERKYDFAELEKMATGE